MNEQTSRQELIAFFQERCRECYRKEYGKFPTEGELEYFWESCLEGDHRRNEE